MRNAVRRRRGRSDAGLSMMCYISEKENVHLGRRLDSPGKLVYNRWAQTVGMNTVCADEEIS